MQAHEIDYQIHGEEMQYVEIELDPQEAVVAEAGSFMMMDNGIQMDTIFGDGSNQNEGIMGKLFSAGKRMLTGENLFMTVFLNQDKLKRRVSFASPYPGKIIPIDLGRFGGKFICQKDAFLCAAKGVTVGIEFSKNLGRGLLEEKVLLCRNWKVTDLLLYMPEVRLPVRSLWQARCLK